MVAGPAVVGPKLDGDHVDVYKGCHAAVIVFDITREETWEHAQATLAGVPRKIPVLLLANFRDLGADRVVPLEDIARVAAVASKERDGGSVTAFESSANDCYGLKTLYNYFNIPFLQRKLTILREELQKTADELDTVCCALAVVDMTGYFYCVNCHLRAISVHMCVCVCAGARGGAMLH